MTSINQIDQVVDLIINQLTVICKHLGIEQLQMPHEEQRTIEELTDPDA